MLRGDPVRGRLRGMMLLRYDDSANRLFCLMDLHAVGYLLCCRE